MVKPLDKNSDIQDHIGWALWQASRAWQAEFAAAMRAAGHGWMTDARAGLLGHVARKGTPQSLLIERLGISKQAVQQLVDGLEAEGVLARAPDPDDRRARVVVHTEAGRRALRDAARIKRRIEAGYRRRLGDETFAALKRALALLDGRGGKDSRE